MDLASLDTATLSALFSLVGLNTGTIGALWVHWRQHQRMYEFLFGRKDDKEGHPGWSKRGRELEARADSLDDLVAEIQREAKGHADELVKLAELMKTEDDGLEERLDRHEATMIRLASKVSTLYERVNFLYRSLKEQDAIPDAHHWPESKEQHELGLSSTHLALPSGS